MEFLPLGLSQSKPSKQKMELITVGSWELLSLLNNHHRLRQEVQSHEVL